MKDYLRKLLKAKWVSLPVVLGAAFVLWGWIWSYARLKDIEQPLIIHFNNYMGITRTGSFWDLSTAGLLAFIMLLVNGALGVEIEERDVFWGKILGLASFLLGVLIFIGFMVIIYVN